MNNYKKLQKIGYGTFGDVILAERISDGKVFYRYKNIRNLLLNVSIMKQKEQKQSATK